MNQLSQIKSSIEYHFKILNDERHEKYVELFKWCTSMFGPCSFEYEGSWYVGTQEFIFRDKDAAMLFKLTWM